ncbi:MAG: bacillithiol biosynthesis BshC [Nannocystaceae bacterium]|nr:bacillithiol biosynthesis BshC [bacterium]
MLEACAVAAVPPVGHVRVVDAAGSCATAPFVEARARVVKLGFGALGSFHAVVPELAALRADDADLVVWDGQGDAAALASALAPGGVVVAPRTCARALASVGLDLRAAAHDAMVLGVDARTRVPVPPALARLDRTQCVDRGRVLEALARAPWTAEGAGGTCEGLVAAVRAQLECGEPDVRALPWPRAEASTLSPGCGVLALMPHPDDETIYAGGTLAGLVRAGSSVHLVVATDGAGGRGGSGLGALRAAELLEACATLGITAVSCLGWADTGKYRDAYRTQASTAADAIRAWGLDRALAELVATIRAHRPKTVLSLDPEVDPNLSLHGHHLGLGVLVAIAFHLAADAAYGPALGPAWAAHEHRVLASPLVASAFDVGATVDGRVKARALRAHRSQAYSTHSLLQRLRRGDPRETVEFTRVAQSRGRAPWLVAAPGSDTRPAFTPPPEGWAARACAVTCQRRDRAALRELFARQNASLPHDPARAAALEVLARPDAVAVVTGQQVGWLGGPAYTLVKALSAVEQARRISEDGIAAVAVFWMATQDHDLDEVACVPTWDGPDVRLPVQGRGAPVGGLRIPPEQPEALARWRACLPPNAAEAESPDAAHTTLAQSFAERLARLTAGTGLLILDPADPAFARLAAPIMARELEGPRRARDCLRVAGGSQVISVERDVTELFVIDDGGSRTRVVEPTAALRGLLRTQPERFSPAALLRPVVQDAVLPVIATVAGPTEARYLQQMQPLYAWAGSVPSVVVRRPSLVPQLAKDLVTLAPFGGVESLARGGHALRRIGELALPAAAQRWLRRCAELDRRLLDAGDGGGWEPLRADAEHALEGTRTLRAWPRHRDAIDALVREATPRSCRAAARRLFALARSLRRDGRRSAPLAVAAWNRLRGAAERRMSVAELCARFGPDVVPAISAVLANIGTRDVVLSGGAA